MKAKSVFIALRPRALPSDIARFLRSARHFRYAEPVRGTHRVGGGALRRSSHAAHGRRIARRHSALKSGRLGGVALDVYEEEEGIFFEDRSGDVLQDDEFSRLLTFPNVLITAHQAFLTREALGEIARVTVQNLIALESGMPLLEGTVLGT